MSDNRDTTAERRTITVEPSVFARWLRQLGDALVSPVRDDGTSRSEFRRSEDVTNG